MNKGRSHKGGGKKMRGRKQGTQSLGSFRVRKLYGEQSEYSWRSTELPAELKEAGDKFFTFKSLQDDKIFPWTAPPQLAEIFPSPLQFWQNKLKLL